MGKRLFLILSLVATGVGLIFLFIPFGSSLDDGQNRSEKVGPTEHFKSPAGHLVNGGKRNPQTQEQTTGERLLDAFSQSARIYQLSPSELGKYIEANRSNSFSLVAAYETSRDKEYIKLAAQLHPNDPLVQSKILFHDVFPEERQKWIDAMKQSAPDNSLPNMLAARELLEKGDINGALGEINAARGKKMNDYFRETATGMIEAYLESGLPMAEAKVIGSAEVLLPHLAQIKLTARLLEEQATAFGETGDFESQKVLLRSAYEMSQQVRNSGKSGILITEMVGIAMENNVLKNWPANEPIPFLKGTPEEQLRANALARDEAKKQTIIYDSWMRQASDAEIITFQDRMLQYGEREAFNWINNRYPNLQPPGQN